MLSSSRVEAELRLDDVRRLHGEALARRPGINVDEPTFAAALARRFQPTNIDEAHAADLLLALGCAASDPAALTRQETLSL